MAKNNKKRIMAAHEARADKETVDNAKADKEAAGNAKADID
jgi:hypothetical protein